LKCLKSAESEELGTRKTFLEALSK